MMRQVYWLVLDGSFNGRGMTWWQWVNCGMWFNVPGHVTLELDICLMFLPGKDQ